MGEWKTVRRHWYDISVRNCSVCGKMLPGEIWSVDIAGRAHAFCDPECEVSAVEAEFNAVILSK